MSKSIEEMYQNLLEQSALFGGIESDSKGSSYSFDEDDDEDFMTSKEIIKRKENLEEKFGISENRGNGDGIIEEDVHFKIYGKRREHKYTEKEMEAIRNSCMCTIVHDYGEHDIYHLTDEERANNDMLAELSMKLGGLKRTYRKVDQYIEAMRVVVQAWALLEKNNFIHTKEEFYKLVSEGKIVSNRIIMPKLKKMDQYNMDMIIKYISNPDADPTDLLPIKEEIRDPWYDQFYDDDDDEDEEEEMMRLLSPEEVQYIIDHADNPPEIKVHDIKRNLIKGYDQRNFKFGKKKKVSKKDKYMIENLHDILNKIQSNPANRDASDYTRSYLVTHSMFDVEKEEKSFFDDLYFDGSWTNKEDLFLYDLAVREELLKQHPPKERYLTYGDKELAKFFNILEENGINTIDLRRKMDCTAESLTRNEEKRSKKENRKIESAIVQRITKLNNNPKFKKIVGKAESALNKYYEG